MFAPARLLSFALVLGAALAAPLNINLGAYSPALVVGDGAIEFDGAGREGVVRGAANAVGPAAGEAAVVPEADAPATVQAAVAPSILTEPVRQHSPHPPLLPLFLLYSSELRKRW